MAFEKYLPQEGGYAETMGTITPSYTAQPVENADSAIAVAEANAERRARIDALNKQVENLENQKKVLQEKLSSLESQRTSLRDEDIVQMAKVKGIRDEDIDSYINARITQRNADFEKQRNEGLVNQNDAMNEANKTAKISEVSDKLDKVVREITTLNVDIGEGDPATKARAEASKRFAEKQYETLKKEYRELSGKEWTDAPEEYVRGASNGPAAAESEAKPEGWSETDFRAWQAADEKGKAGIEAKYSDKETEKAKAERELKRKRAGIVSQAKNKNLSEAAKSLLVTKYRNTFKEGEKPTRSEITKILFGE